MSGLSGQVCWGLEGRETPDPESLLPPPPRGGPRGAAGGRGHRACGPRAQCGAVVGRTGFGDCRAGGPGGGGTSRAPLPRSLKGRARGRAVQAASRSRPGRARSRAPRVQARGQAGRGRLRRLSAPLPPPARRRPALPPPPRPPPPLLPRSRRPRPQLRSASPPPRPRHPEGPRRARGAPTGGGGLGQAVPRPRHGPAVRGCTRWPGPGAVSGAAGPLCPQGPRAPGPRPSRSRLGGREGVLGGTHAGWRVPSSVLCARQGLLNKAAFRDQFRGGWSIRRIRLSWRWGRERKPGTAGSGPGSAGATREPQASVQGVQTAGPIVSWALPSDPHLLYKLVYMCVLMGWQRQLGGRGPGVLGAGACWQSPLPWNSFENLFLFPVSQL